MLTNVVGDFNANHQLRKLIISLMLIALLLRVSKKKTPYRFEEALDRLLLVCWLRCFALAHFTSQVDVRGKITKKVCPVFVAKFVFFVSLH